MSWIRRLFTRDAYNPELYYRVPCLICGDRGVIAASALPADPRVGSPRVRTCGACRGTDYVLVRTPDWTEAATPRRVSPRRRRFLEPRSPTRGFRTWG